MNEREVNEALAQVREIQTLVLDHQRFVGFSGVAHMLGGVAAIVIAVVLQQAVPAEPRYHLIGWGLLLLVGIAANFSGLAYWFLKNSRGLGMPERWAAAEVFPALIVGAALSFALIRIGQLDLLFGTWMSLYGLSHLVYRRNLPLWVYCSGLAYVAAGIFCLLWPGVSFTDPRPMGSVFGIGELFEGWVLFRSQRAKVGESL